MKNYSVFGLVLEILALIFGVGMIVISIIVFPFDENLAFFLIFMIGGIIFIIGGTALLILELMKAKAISE